MVVYVQFLLLARCIPTERRGVYEISVILRTDRQLTSVPGRAFLEEL